jgi:hypothetical protein
MIKLSSYNITGLCHSPLSFQVDGEDNDKLQIKVRRSTEVVYFSDKGHAPVNITILLVIY